MNNLDSQSDQDVMRSNQLVDLICGVLSGETPEAQGAALAQLVALFIAGHAPPLRESNLTMLMECASELVPGCVDTLIATGQAPPDWHGPRKH